jgi:hypothetical protein
MDRSENDNTCGSHSPRVKPCNWPTASSLVAPAKISPAVTNLLGFASMAAQSHSPPPVISDLKPASHDAIPGADEASDLARASLSLGRTDAGPKLYTVKYLERPRKKMKYSKYIATTYIAHKSNIKLRVASDGVANNS